MSSQLERHGKKQAEVFCFGDGLGFDSSWLAMQGHRMKYYEPSLQGQQYARRVFEANNVHVSQLESLDEIEPNSLDAIVCLDVLEHVPQPQNLIQAFHGWLKPTGLLFVHAPFWCLHWTRPTHLKENRCFSGDLKNLYHKQGFSEVDASFFGIRLCFKGPTILRPIREHWGPWSACEFLNSSLRLAAGTVHSIRPSLAGSHVPQNPSANHWIRKCCLEKSLQPSVTHLTGPRSNVPLLQQWPGLKSGNIVAIFGNQAGSV